MDTPTPETVASPWINLSFLFQGPPELGAALRVVLDALCHDETAIGVVEIDDVDVTLLLGMSEVKGGQDWASERYKTDVYRHAHQAMADAMAREDARLALRR